MRQFESPSNSVAPAADIASIARYDLRDNQKYELVVGGETKHYTANEINMMILEDAGKVTDKTDEQIRIHKEWVKAAEARERDVMDLNLISGAVTKLASIRRKQEKADREVDQFTAIDLASDQRFTTVFRATKEQAEKQTAKEIYASSPAAALRGSVKMQGSPPVTELEIQEAVYRPPKSTRAHIRGYLVRKQAELNVTSVSWKQCTVSEKDENGKAAISVFTFEPLGGSASTDQ
jgi:hypothetical protein